MENWGAPKIKGRGMVKWNPFKSVVEQYDEINKMISDQNKVNKPILTEDTKERIQQSLQQSLTCNEEIFLSYYRNGYLHHQYITVTSIDPGGKLIHCFDAFNTPIQFKFDELVDIK
ncbi:3-oxoacyl-ACP synthase [Bacillus cereus]|nr:3-oxoacyl-ACP synthase [Bacillus cereus]